MLNLDGWVDSMGMTNAGTGIGYLGFGDQIRDSATWKEKNNNYVKPILRLTIIFLCISHLRMAGNIPVWGNCQGRLQIGGEKKNIKIVVTITPYMLETGEGTDYDWMVAVAILNCLTSLWTPRQLCSEKESSRCLLQGKSWVYWTFRIDIWWWVCRRGPKHARRRLGH